MEAPIELFVYMSLVGALWMIVKGHKGARRRAASLFCEPMLASVREQGANGSAMGAALPSRPLFLPRRRKIPMREQASRTDEDGRPSP
ncbi:hypothetical protein ACPVTF_09055 [Geobacillus icigianus]|uniref:Uncharacterized protein n=1 Tax=Geobacillus subterraneus TaxID=129338 RepID=A0A679FKE0_9BACL|nr:MULTISPECIES: hypothetical protein [Geobacillus]KYD30589.1 hypothetical protein B4113_3976 [Geobacillus sp. B4113_201601]BBW96280.1 hypothetical protein GsuE55_11130 [Geobacillus subterraneus]